MKKALLVFLMIIGIPALTLAQVQPPAPAQGNLNGNLYANGYAGWSVPAGNNGPFSWSSPQACTANAGGTTFPAFTAGTPIRILDQVTPANNETVTVTSVLTTPEQCSISTTTPAFPHTQFSLASATAGLQEAINANLASSVPLTVVLTADYFRAGGTITQVLSSITGNSNIGIVDETQAPSVWYQWSGSHYVAVTIGAGGCPGTACVQSLNSLQGAVNLVQGSNIILTPSGNNLTIASTGGGSGLTGGPWNVGRYGSATGTAPVAPSSSAFVIDSTTTLSQLNALIASLTVAPTNAPATQLGTITIPDGVGALPLTNIPNTSGAGNPGVPVNDIRQGARTAPLSTWGVVANARAFLGTFTQGSTSVTAGAISVLPTDVGNTIVVTGTVAGVPTRFTPTVSSVAGNVYTLSTPAPFTGFFGGTIGYLNTTNFQRAMTALQVGYLTGQLGNGCILTDTISWNAGQSLVGVGSANSCIIGLPGDDIFQAPDSAAGGSVSRAGLLLKDISLTLDQTIDATKPWADVNASGVTTSHAALYRPAATGYSDPAANNPLAPGWAANATNGVASITSSSAVICVPTTYFSRLNATAGNQIVFRDTPTVFKTTVSSLSGAGCASGFSGATLAAPAPATLTQTEWVQTTQVQSLAVAIPSGSITYPYTITVANSTAPIPGFESNVATHGRVKIGSYEFDYLGTTPTTLILRDGPATVTALAIGTAVVPENPCYANYEVPWPVTPTVNSGDSTPSGAAYFAGMCVGNAAISLPQANGNVYHGTGFSNARLENIIINASTNSNANNTAGMYFAGNTDPYGSTFDTLEIVGTTFNIVAGPASAGQHGVASAQATGQGNHFQNLTLRGAYNLFLDNTQSSTVHRVDAYTTLINPYDSSVIGSATAFDFGITYDEQTGAAVSFPTFIDVTNINSEPENGTHAEKPFYLISNCLNCTFTDDNLEGAGEVFGGDHQVVKAGNQLSQPIVNYGSHNLFEETVQSTSGPVSNVWGTCTYCEWGSFSRAGLDSANGVGPVQNVGIGDRQPYSGDTSMSYLTGNYNPAYGSLEAGYIAPEEMNGGNQMGQGKTLDSTEPKAGAYTACNVNPGVCNVSNFNGFNGAIAIGPWDRIKPTLNDLTMNLKVASGTITLQLYVYALNAFGTCSTPGVVAQVSANLTTTWQSFSWPVNFAGYSGCSLQLSFEAFSGNALAEVGATQFTPAVGVVHAPLKTYTAGAACPTWSVAGDILGIDATNQYFCGSATTVVADSLSGGTGGITALTGDATASGTGSVAATVGNINGGTPFKSQGAGPECNSGSTGQLNNCINLNVTGTVIGGVYTVPSSATSVFDLTQANSQRLTLAQNTTSTLIAGSAGGQDVNFQVCENSTGGYTFAWPTNFNGAPPINMVAGQCTTARGYYDGTAVNVDGWNSPLCQIAASGGAYQCGAAYKGLAAIPAGTNSTIVVDTTALGPNSLVFVQGDESAAVPGVTCGTSNPSGPLVVSARTAGVSFTLEAPGTISGSYCFTYFIVPTP